MVCRRPSRLRACGKKRTGKHFSGPPALMEWLKELGMLKLLGCSCAQILAARNYIFLENSTIVSSATLANSPANHGIFLARYSRTTNITLRSEARHRALWLHSAGGRHCPAVCCSLGMVCPRLLSSWSCPQPSSVATWMQW